MMLEGFQVMVIGVSVVFGFLALLVAMMNVSARFFAYCGDRFPFAATILEDAVDPGSVRHSLIAAAIAVAIAQNQAREQEISNG